MELRIETDDLKKIKISLTQYIYLWSIYHRVKVKFFDISEEGIQELYKDKYIGKVVGEEDKYGLTEKGIELFEPSGGIFDTFIQVFPTRVTNHIGQSRVLSPASADTLAGKKMKRKWYSMTKNKIEVEEHILKCLEKEVELRKKEGSLYWMRNIEAWLNKATWEDYEYLLETQTKEEITTSNVIKL